MPANFPFKLIEVSGHEALQKWQELKASNQGTPIILDPDIERIGEPFEPTYFPNGPRSLAQILDASQRLSFPDGLIALRKAEDASASAEIETMRNDPNASVPTIVEIGKDGQRRTLSREEAMAAMSPSDSEPLGEWPASPSVPVGLTVASDIMSGKPLKKVYLAIIPTEDATTIPAHLRWGDWNENPSPEWHVAALRSWRDRYGAELVGISADTMNVRVQRRPQSRDEAIALAREQYAYCSDIVDQGVGTISQLARNLMVDDWWFFWWD